MAFGRTSFFLGILIAGGVLVWFIGPPLLQWAAWLRPPGTLPTASHIALCIAWLPFLLGLLGVLNLVLLLMGRRRIVLTIPWARTTAGTMSVVALVAGVVIGTTVFT